MQNAQLRVNVYSITPITVEKAPPVPLAQAIILIIIIKILVKSKTGPKDPVIMVSNVVEVTTK